MVEWMQAPNAIGPDFDEPHTVRLRINRDRRIPVGSRPAASPVPSYPRRSEKYLQTVFVTGCLFGFTAANASTKYHSVGTPINGNGMRMVCVDSGNTSCGSDTWLRERRGTALLSSSFEHTDDGVVDIRSGFLHRKLPERRHLSDARRYGVVSSRLTLPGV